VRSCGRTSRMAPGESSTARSRPSGEKQSNGLAQVIEPSHGFFRLDVMDDGRVARTLNDPRGGSPAASVGW
jgi:hypothetical protein